MINGTLVISLDFELFWGVRDKRNLSDYQENLENVHIIIPRLLQIFEKYRIHATWAYVGLLGLKNYNEYFKLKPRILPLYKDKKLSPYEYAEKLTREELLDECHNGNALIEMIQNSLGQELATHTFSHYYTLEPRQNLQAFTEDLKAAKELSIIQGIGIESIIFPRNQYDDEHLQACREMGIKAFRGTPKIWAYQTHENSKNTRARRLIRLIDSYVNICGHKHATLETTKGMTNVPASSFLRPYHRRLKLIEPLKLYRIKHSMKKAAQKGAVYHLWWHPHNFGVEIEENLNQLEILCKFYLRLKEQYGFKSLNMSEISELIRSDECIRGK